MSDPRRPRAKGLRRIERWMVGLVMAVLAFILEKVVMRSVRKGGARDKKPAPTTVTSRGTEVDISD